LGSCQAGKREKRMQVTSVAGLSCSKTREGGGKKKKIQFVSESPLRKKERKEVKGQKKQKEGKERKKARGCCGGP